MDDPAPLFNKVLLVDFINPVGFDTVIAYISLFFLLLLSALISGSEVAFFSLNPNERDIINNSDTKRHLNVKRLLDTPKRLLATILVTNNFVNVAIIIISTFAINNTFNVNEIPEWLNLLIQVVGITFILLLFGEVIPKVYATKHALDLASLMAKPLLILKSIFKPVSSLLIFSTVIIDKKVKKKGLDVSVEELSIALELTEDIPENKDEHRILKGIVKFGETSVKQVMKARVNVVAIEKNQQFDKVIDVILKCGHSRIPIYENSFDQIIGLLYVKDMLTHIDQSNDFKWTKLIRPPFFVPENKKLDDLLEEFQEKKIHLAIVVDEYGGTSGIITLEDVLEEIVGEISDEFDADDVSYSKLDDNTFIFEGKTAINDLVKILKLENEYTFEEVQKDADTLAGLVIELAGKIPQKNEKVIFKNFIFIVEAADKRRVKRIKLIKSNVIEEE